MSRESTCAWSITRTWSRAADDASGVVTGGGSIQRLEHLGPTIAVYGSCPAKHQLNPLEGRLIPGQELALDLTEAPHDPSLLEHGDAVQHDLRDGPVEVAHSHARAPRPERRDGHERSTSRRGHQEASERLRRDAGAAGYRQFEPGGPSRQLELPAGASTLGPTSQRHPAPRETMVCGVIVDRGEHSGSQSLPGQVGEPEAWLSLELEFALEEYLHVVQVSGVRGPFADRCARPDRLVETYERIR